jgi:hypothetical protein
LTTTIDSTVPGVSLDNLKIDAQSNTNQTVLNDNVTIVMLDEPVKVLGQLIFKVNQPANHTITQNGVQCRVSLEYDLEGKQVAEIQILASAYSISDDLPLYRDEKRKDSFLEILIADNLNPNQPPADIKDWEQVFNYRLEMQSYNVSYIACRNLEMYPKFLRDPSFSLVFINSEVAIFKVNGNLNQKG